MAATSIGDAVGLIRKDQLQQAHETLRQAFMDYPLVAHLFPAAEDRERNLPVWTGYPLRYGLRYGLVYTTPAADGVAVWVDPANTHMTVARHLRSGLIELPLRVGLRTFQRMLSIEAYMEERWVKVLPQKHWYLWMMGVRPDARRQGIGAALVEYGLRQADAGGYPCCLETHSRENVDFYQKFGFQTITADSIPGHEINVFMMVREPRPQSGSWSMAVISNDAFSQNAAIKLQIGGVTRQWIFS